MSQQEEFEKKEETQAQPAENLTEEVLNEPISEQEAVEIPAPEPGKENAEVPPVPPYPAPNPVPPVNSKDAASVENSWAYLRQRCSTSFIICRGLTPKVGSTASG